MDHGSAHDLTRLQHQLRVARISQAVAIARADAAFLVGEAQVIAHLERRLARLAPPAPAPAPPFWAGIAPRLSPLAIPPPPPARAEAG